MCLSRSGSFFAQALIESATAFIHIKIILNENNDRLTPEETIQKMYCQWTSDELRTQQMESSTQDLSPIEDVW